MADIIEVILADHERILRLQTALHDVARYHPGVGPHSALASTWDRLAVLIEIHTEAEEEICYLAMFGTSARGLEQMQQAIADHDDIREALGEARLQPAGSPGWWRAVKAALSTWTEQIDREERRVLAGFACRVGRAQRDNLARQWVAFTTTRHSDLSPQAHPGGAVCQACQWPLPGSHHHVIDVDRCAVLCTCPTCYVLIHQANDGQDHHRWPRPGGMRGKPPQPSPSGTS